MTISERPRPSPGPGQVLVRIRRAGVCGTDLHIFEGSHPFLEYPRVIGHELSGEVAETGAGCAISIGQQVYVVPYLACGVCVACRRGKTNCCQRIGVLGVHIDGGMADYVCLPEATGVNVKAVTYLAYVISAFCAAFVGILLAMRIGIGNPTQGEGWELQAIASSVIGGTSLFGAVGSVHGPLIGSFILTTINNGANLLNLNPFWQRIITGALIIIVVYFDSLRRRKR